MYSLTGPYKSMTTLHCYRSLLMCHYVYTVNIMINILVHYRCVCKCIARLLQPMCRFHSVPLSRHSRHSRMSGRSWPMTFPSDVLLSRNLLCILNIISRCDYLFQSHQDDLESLILWLSNTVRFLHLLKQYSGEKSFQVFYYIYLYHNAVLIVTHSVSSITKASVFIIGTSS